MLEYYHIIICRLVLNLNVESQFQYMAFSEIGKEGCGRK